MKYKLLIFDMDGTILDTLQDLYNCLNFALAKNGYPERTFSEVRSFVGNGLEKLTERGLPEGTPESKTKAVLADLKDYYKEHCKDETKPYDGILELLKTVKEKGYQTAVVSNKADFAVQELVRQYFPNMFDMALGEREGQRKKPEQDMVYNVLAALGVSKEDAVYIGDSEVDIATAQNAGVESIIVEWGFRERSFLERMGAKRIVQKPFDILELI